MLESCHDKEAKQMHASAPPYEVWLENETDTSYMLKLSVEGREMDSIPIPYPVYRLELADLSGDGIPEVCLGVENRTRYWHEKAKRIHIYKLYHRRYIRPLWLGSRIGHPLEDFEICRDSVPAYIHTHEMDKEGNKIESLYRLQGFGLKFDKYMKFKQ